MNKQLIIDKLSLVPRFIVKSLARSLGGNEARGLIIYVFATTLYMFPHVGLSQDLYVSSVNAGSRLKAYTLSTGLLDSNFVSPAITNPAGLAVAGNVLYAGFNNGGSSVVDAFDPRTGTVISGFTSINGITNPVGLAASSTTLYVSNSNNRVGAYSATTGKALDANFITGLSNPTGLLVSGNILFVASLNNTIGTYDSTTGSPINASFLTGLGGPYQMALSNNILYVAEANNNMVAAFNATTGTALGGFSPPNVSSGLNAPLGVTVVGNDLYVADSGSNVIREFDATTGLIVGNYNSPRGLNGPDFLAVYVIPEPSVCITIVLASMIFLAISLRRKHASYN